METMIGRLHGYPLREKWSLNDIVAFNLLMHLSFSRLSTIDVLVQEVFSSFSMVILTFGLVNKSLL